jgi:hypothetical protein
MARIRTIKPEFPQSESMGRVSREARLLFILLWTHVDDSGRARASSRMLASLLYPYDDDAKDLIDGWMAELEAEGCLDRYVADGNQYLQVRNWLNHQKIDRPSASKIPAPPESFANPREESRGLVVGSGSGSGSGPGSGPVPGPVPTREAVPRGTLAPILRSTSVPVEVMQRIRGCYPPGLYRDVDWLLAEREIARRIGEAEQTSDLVSAAAAYGIQQQALGKVGTQYVLKPSKFFSDEGHWRGPFPLPAKAETATEAILRMNSPHNLDRVIEHG